MKIDVVNHLTKLENFLDRIRCYALKTVTTDIPGEYVSQALLNDVECVFGKEISEVAEAKKHAAAGNMGAVRLAIDQSLGKAPNLNGTKYANLAAPFFQKNYDYGEGWNTVLDEFRKSKVKNVIKYINHTKDKPKKKTTRSLEIATSEQMLDQMDIDGGSESLLPLVVYSPESTNYWKQLKKMKDGKSKAVQDYIDYVGKQ